MKVKINIDDNIIEDEIIINCRHMTDTISKIQNMILDSTKHTPTIIFYKDEKEYYLDMNKILFFETEINNTYAHTVDESYIVRRRLYELENILPRYFIRISKSTIININQILSISSSFGSSNLIELNRSHKQVYASRRYIKALKHKLEERRN